MRWPPAKAYWRAMLARARELGLDRGAWPELFAERHFYSHFGRASAFNQLNRGSLFERLLPEPAPSEVSP
ncbi:hypothetical protein [Nannocystis pusilla]|uniref:hypothetical protein n=1 Tax=Nannocystis pusilla TaxID=889268 RepID=UPI003B7E0084